MMNLFNGIKPYFVALTILLTFNSSLVRANVILGDELFSKKDYQGALSQYLKSAEIGSPHAYYQLGLMYYKGLGLKKNVVQSLVWLSLASEYKHSDSEQLVEQMMSSLMTEERQYFEQLILAVKQSFGKQLIQDKYFPEIITANLKSRVTFGGAKALSGEIESVYESDNSLYSDYDSGFVAAEVFANSAEGESLFGGGANLDDAANQDHFAARNNRPYLFIADYDVATDGSIRNIDSVRSIGPTRRAQQSLLLHQFSPPSFKGRPVHFVNRTYMGLAAIEKLRMIKEFRSQYDSMRRKVKKLKNSTSINEQFQYAKLALNIRWLGEDKVAAKKILKNVASQGHPQAQYELGIKLYSSQSNPKNGIEWIQKASQYGMPEAEYRLATIIQYSPWVKNDEKKALFWYEMAAKQEYFPAVLKVIELKLLADDSALLNQKQAVEMLASVPRREHDNPTYNYLLAEAHLKGEYRDFKKAVKHLRKAIGLGRYLNWDVSRWDQRLAGLTTGKVYMSEE